MAEEIVGTIENVDRLFSEIIVNGESHVSENYVAPTPTETNHSTPSQSTSTQESESTESNPSPAVTQTQGEDVHAVELNHVLHDFSDPDITLDVQTLQQGLADEVSARSLADQALDSAIAQETNARSSADTTLQGNINTISGNVSTLQGKVSTIEGEIPSQASSSNQLADKNFVNSSIATNTANFLGTYTSLADIEAIPNPTNNDYVFLQTTDSAGNNLFDRYKYNADQEEWLFEYELNNSSFTAEQWATINSGLTQSVVTQEIADALASATIGHADEADKLSTARNLKVALGSNNAQSFDGTANATSIGVGGTLPIGNGGTGQTTQADVNKAIIGALSAGSSDVTDGTEFVSSYASDNGFSDSNAVNVPYKRSFLKVWNYIKGKISSVLGLTVSSYGGNSATATSAGSATTSSRLGSITIANIRIGSAQAKITLNQLMTWLITTKAYIPSGTDCYKVLGVPWDYSGNDILQLTANGASFELQLAGCLIEFMGNATSYNAGRFRLRIHSSPATSFTVTSGYLKFPVSSIAEYTCNGNAYSPVWKIVGIDEKYANNYWGMTDPDNIDSVWIRTTSQGIIPYQSGGASDGHCALGTSSWYFASAYIQNIYGTLTGNATSATTATSAVNASNATKLGNIAVRTSSIGGTATETGNHWAYVTKAKFTTTSGYIVYSNGLIIQWGQADRESAFFYGNITLHLSYTSKSTYQIFGTIIRNSVQSNSVVMNKTGVNTAKFYCNDNMPCAWYAIGY